ncbi:glycosyltransferase family 4 protein [Metabacillus litoralis]|uniref:glycosyltransferase family 4 protein n=1 Tax=Metabacillus litoralis TaxID=152268 RepID=UPI00131561FE|nr:glycosyltransferase family 4 protein [Metabacillus litoralis]
MKPQLLAKGFLFTLSYHYYPAQNRLLRLYLESGKPLNRGLQLISKVIKSKKSEVFIEAIRRSISLSDKEKRIIQARTYLQLELYEYAWNSIKSISSTESDIFILKEKILFQMRDIDEYLILLKEKKEGSSLTLEEKQELLLFASLKGKWEQRHDLALLFKIEEINQTGEVLYPNENQSIDQYLKLYSGIHKYQAFSYLMQKYELNVDVYKELIQLAIKVNDDNTSSFLPTSSTFIHDLYAAENAICKNDYLFAFNKIIDAFEKGERSLYLKSMLLKVLKHQGTGAQHQQKIARMIQTGFLDIVNTDFIDVLLKQESSAFLFQYVKVEQLTIEKFNVFIEGLVKSTSSIRIKVIEAFLNVLYHYDYQLPLDNKSFELLEETPLKNPLYKVVKGKWLIDENKIDELDSVFNSGRKKYWVYMQLIDYAFEKEKYGLSLMLANKAVKIRSFDPILIRKLASIHHRIGNLRDKLTYLKKIRFLLFGAFRAEYKIAKDEILLYEKLWTWDRQIEKIDVGTEILHVLNKSLPEVNGYTIRSKEIVHHQKNLGLEPVVVTKYGWPTKPRVTSLEHEMIDGIDHYRLHSPKNRIRLNIVPLSDYFSQYADEFLELIRKVKPKIVHAASNFQNALPALIVAKKAGIPSVYEVRGLWQDSTASKIPEFDGSDRYLMQQKYELYCCEIADRVVVIGDSLAAHLVNLGVNPGKIDIVPNGVDTSVFYPQEKNVEIIQKYKLEHKTVYGFIGSITKYEGLNDLLYAFALLKKEKNNIHFLLIGDGPALPQIREQVATLKLTNNVSIVGRVPHTEVKDFYSVIDIFPFPRINAKVCRLVTPLKPFEVMAMGKLVMVSNIPALNEMVIHEETGLMFNAEDIQALKRCLSLAPEYKELGIASREWVVKNREWSILSKLYIDVYKKIERN